ncbi:hypothetical protein [Terriglobus sp.]|uniref:hypothetical protein n=1 Tax=Terriglobus sp. TaxID=1889013 RepID=UPI003AFFE00A
MSSWLEAAERDAVLGDLAEENTSGWRAVAAISGLVARRAGMRLRKRQALMPARVGAAEADEVMAESWPEWLVPLAVGLIAATCVVALLVPPRPHTLSWPGVVSRSALLLVVAAAAAIAAVGLFHRAYREYFRRPGAALLACAWSSAIWIPLLLLVWSQHAIWVVLTPVPIAGLVASFAKRKQHAGFEADALTVVSSNPIFEAAVQLNTLRFARIAVAIACLLELCAFAAALRDLPLTCSLVILTTACVAWAFTPTRTTGKPQSAAPVRARITVLPCFLLTCLALTPFLRLGLGSSRLTSVVLANPLSGAPHLAAVPARTYARVVLLAPPLPKRKLLVDPHKTQFGGAVRLAHPLVIRFDGAYWYFQSPVPGAKYEVKVQRGDPTKGHIYANDFMPLQMEAHQSLGTRLNTSCCQSMSVVLVNADTRLGSILVEAKLRNLTDRGTESVSLGVVPIRSSQVQQISTARPSIRETLRFPITGKAASFQFNEITLVFKLAREREMAGARVQVSSFTLQP